MMTARALILVAMSALTCLTALGACSVYDDALLPAQRAEPSESSRLSAGAASVRAESAGSSGRRAGNKSTCEFDTSAGSCAVAVIADVDGGARSEEIDLCPSDETKRRPGVCGCGKSDRDSDGDGTADCVDSCPHDPAKTAAGVCGCGKSDRDSDRDGTADCVDACPKDAHKTSLGACGCGASDDDSDRDGTADCIDGCAMDGAKTSPGVCGCGQADPDDARGGTLYCAKSQLLHRYSFEGSDSVALDSIGMASGEIVGGKAAVQAAGAVSLAGDRGLGTGSEGYVSLPSAAWKGLRSATFECWVTWRGKGPAGDSPWQRIFDFGDQRNGKAHSYIFLTPEGKGGVRSAFSLNGNGADVETSVVGASPLPLDTLKHVAVVVDEPASLLSLYVDGMPQGSAPLTGKLTDITASNLWLGRSNFSDDPAFFGSIHEFRIYAVALRADQLHASFELGPDYTFSP